MAERLEHLGEACFAAEVPAGPAVEALTDVQRQSVTMRARVAADAGCLPAISGWEWLALLAERDRLAAKLAAIREALDGHRVVYVKDLVAALDADAASPSTPEVGRG